ncbi:unnamed protein product [Ectocarpus sp. 12 AP-2014]
MNRWTSVGRVLFVKRKRRTGTTCDARGICPKRSQSRRSNYYSLVLSGCLFPRPSPRCITLFQCGPWVSAGAIDLPLGCVIIYRLEPEPVTAATQATAATEA